MSGMSSIPNQNWNPFKDTPKQGCGAIFAMIFFLIIGTPILMVMSAVEWYTDSCAERACLPDNCIVATITETGDASEELASLCRGHLEGPVIVVEDDGQFDTVSFYKVDQDFPWGSSLPRPRFVRNVDSYEVYVYAIFVGPDPKQKTKNWWSENGYEGGIKGQSQAYAQFIGKSRGRLYDVDFEYDEEYPPTYLMEAATKQTDKSHVRNWVKAHQDLGE